MKPHLVDIVADARRILFHPQKDFYSFALVVLEDVVEYEVGREDKGDPGHQPEGSEGDVPLSFLVSAEEKIRNGADADSDKDVHRFYFAEETLGIDCLAKDPWEQAEQEEYPKVDPEQASYFPGTDGRGYDKNPDQHEQ